MEKATVFRSQRKQYNKSFSISIKNWSEQNKDWFLDISNKKDEEKS